MFAEHTAAALITTELVNRSLLNDCVSALVALAHYTQTVVQGITSSDEFILRLDDRHG